MNLKPSVNEPAISLGWLGFGEPEHKRDRAALQCSDISTVTQETLDKEKSNESRTPRSNCRQTESLLRFPSPRSDAEKWASGSTRCNKGDADHTEGKETCLQPVKCWRVAYRES